MNFRMIQAVIKCFERSTVERIEENPIRTCRAAYFSLRVAVPSPRGKTGGRERLRKPDTNRVM